MYFLIHEMKKLIEVFMIVLIIGVLLVCIVYISYIMIPIIVLSTIGFIVYHSRR